MDTIAVLDFGGQYCHLIARRVRDCGVRAVVLPSRMPASVLRADASIRGIILSGGARSVYAQKAPPFDNLILSLPLPILGICYGHQLIAHTLGGIVASGSAGEYGLTTLRIMRRGGLFARCGRAINVWMNHRDVVTHLPPLFVPLATTEHSHIAAFAHRTRPLFGVQFHPEVSHTEKGEQILQRFVHTVCGCKPSWTPGAAISTCVAEARATIGTARTIIGLSGGIDSSVAAALLSRAIGRRLHAVYVDTGLMREGETEEVERMFRRRKLRLTVVRAAAQFLAALRGVRAPERKRKIIGALFADIFTRIARKDGARFLVQGTIYSDRIESGATEHAAVIKSHHNVGGLPKELGLTVYEPLRDFYKDEVRAMAKKMGLPRELLTRQVFPGPGLAVRIVGAVTPGRVAIARHAGNIIEEELRRTRFWKDIWMSFAVLLPIRSVGIQGDERSYASPVVVRIVESRDAMTANVARIPFPILERIASRITNEVHGVNRVVYDITGKPPATMEWE